VGASAPVQFDESWGATWRADLRAGLVVFLVALPLCLGVALASGAPLSAGLVTGIVGGVVVARLSGSQLMVSGPAAGLTAIVFVAIGQLGFPAFLVAVVLAGALQLVLFALRAGIIAYFFPSSVIKGMLAAIGLTLVIKQLPYVFGAGIGAAETAVRAGPTIIAALSLAILVAWDRPALARIKQLVPAPLAVVAAALAASLGFAAMPALAIPTDALVQLPRGGWREALIAPDWSSIGSPAVWGVAVTLALVASLETLLSLDATDKLDPLKRTSSANRELMAQGTGNIITGLLGGLPMTGVIVRSAVNVGAGGRTWRSSCFHGLLLLLAVLVLAPVLARIPLAALAMILVHTGFRLAHPRAFRDAMRAGVGYGVPFVATVVAILATDLLVGIAIGLAVGAFFVLLESYKHAYVYHREESADHHVVRLSLAEEVSFLNKARINAALRELPDGCVATVDGSRSRYIDPDVIEILHEFRERAAAKRVELRLVGIPERSMLTSAH
jgi:MFS superfamily sulfate permease-like transporter